MDGKQEHRFPCNTCGSDLRFDPGADQLICEHCGATEALDDGDSGSDAAIRELDFLRALRQQLPEAEISEIRTLSCENCGAHVEFEPNTHAAECPFCATPVVTDTGAERQIKPHGLLPFKLAEEKARNAMTNWLGRLWFAPGGLKEYARKGRKMQGIYVPYWTYDADTKSRYTGQRGDAYYETRQVRVVVDGKPKMRQEKIRKVRWSNARGRVARFFDDVLVLGSASLPKRYTDALGPWDLSDLAPYRPEYLAGFRAEGYTVSLEDGFDEAQAYMNRMIRRDVKFAIGGDEQRISNIDTDIDRQTFKHILLPVWLAAYKYRGRTFRFVVNGRTGAVQGERPYSAMKITIAVVLGLLVAGAVGYAIAMNG
ncbi:MAG: primosomal protein N' (replication factor Y) - superfamily II helicase [Rhodobacteraceae bacterium]|nr:primosomal protein N' (replication factor Y) - superfamily II helicase [Paracoccaceae bacterium]